MNTQGYIPDASRIKKLNDAEYIKFKLWAKYLVLMAFFICLGAFVYHLSGDKQPSIIIERIRSVWLPTEKYDMFIDFFIAIIYNSVDIFKISFIILIAGFTYISDVIANISTSVFGICTGISLGCCLDLIKYQGSGTVKIVLIITAMILCSITLISNCVCSCLTAQKFSEYRNVNILLTSEFFWRYIGRFLISFGYILIVYIVYVLIYKFIG